MQSKYISLCYEFYCSDFNMAEFCRLKGVSYDILNSWYNKQLPKRGVIFDKEARSKRLSEITNRELSIEVKEHDTPYKQIVEEILELFKKYAIKS